MLAASHLAGLGRRRIAHVSGPERFEAVLRAKYEEFLSVAEIANRWQVSGKAVESLLTRARHAFRETFSRVNKEP